MCVPPLGLLGSPDLDGQTGAGGDDELKELFLDGGVLIELEVRNAASISRSLVMVMSCLL